MKPPSSLFWCNLWTVPYGFGSSSYQLLQIITLYRCISRINRKSACIFFNRINKVIWLYYFFFGGRGWGVFWKSIFLVYFFIWEEVGLWTILLVILEGLKGWGRAEMHKVQNCLIAGFVTTILPWKVCKLPHFVFRDNIAKYIAYLFLTFFLIHV